jgi:beta-phosphoglucomutase-like phosphatase (HAD superfamily)
VTQRSAIIFDLDGTLSNTMPFHARAWQLAFAALHEIRMEPLEAYLHEGEKAEDFARFIFSKYWADAPSAEDVESVTDAYKTELADIFVLRFFPGALELVERLHGSGYRLGLVSGSKDVRTRFSGMEKFLRCFSAIVSGDDTAQGKPAPDPYLLACKLLGSAPEECLVIENAPFGIISARAAGIECWAVLNDSLVPGAELLRCGAVRLFEQIAEVTFDN